MKQLSTRCYWPGTPNMQPHEPGSLFCLAHVLQAEGSQLIYTKLRLHTQSESLDAWLQHLQPYDRILAWCNPPDQFSGGIYLYVFVISRWHSKVSNKLSSLPRSTWHEPISPVVDRRKYGCAGENRIVTVFEEWSSSLKASFRVSDCKKILSFLGQDCYVSHVP